MLKFDMVNAKPIKTPMPTNGYLDLNDEGKAVDTKVYRSMIGSLLFYAHLGSILCLVCACVLDFKLTQKSVTWWPLRES